MKLTLKRIGGRLKICYADEHRRQQVEQPIREQVAQRGVAAAADRWAPAIKLMREGGHVADFERSEPSYKTDHAAAMLALARLVEK